MDARLVRDPYCLAEEGGSGGGGAEAVAAGPYLCRCIVDTRLDVLGGRHVGGEKVEVGYVWRELQVINCQKYLVFFVCENFFSYGSAKC